MSTFEKSNVISKPNGSAHMLGLIDSVNMSRIRSSKTPIREDSGDITSLVMSIQEVGLLHPIVVRIQDSKFEVVAGNRRYLACKKLGWRKIPSHIVDLGDKESFEISLIENVQRKTMNPIEEANAYNLYVQSFGWGGESELAIRIGKSQEYISKRIKLLELPKEIQEQIIRRRIKSSVAEELCYIKDKSEMFRLAELAEGQITVKKLREISKHDIVESFPTITNSEFVGDLASFDKAVIVLKLALGQIDEILNTKISFVVKELMMRERINIHSQIDFMFKSKKKYSRLLKSNGMKWLM